MGDKTVADVRVNRDPRLSIFLKEPGQKNILFEVDNNEGTEVVMEEPYPAITSGDGERGYATGYALRKGGSFNRKYYANGGGYTAAVCFRAAEALLNYMEASYLSMERWMLRLVNIGLYFVNVPASVLILTRLSLQRT